MAHFIAKKRVPLITFAMLAVVAAGAGMLFMPFSAQAAAVNTSGGLAIQGYDAVAYFTSKKAVKGNASIVATHKGATYRFSSEDNRRKFVANPAKYAPAYGGYCAYAVANGYTAKIDPQAFRVVNGRLYLNYSKRVRGIWERDVPGNISKGNKNWPTLSRQ